MMETIFGGKFGSKNNVWHFSEILHDGSSGFLRKVPVMPKMG